MTDRTFLFTPITTLDEAKAFVQALVAADLLFHFEDDPFDTVNVKSGARTFTDGEATAVALRQGEMYALDWDAHGCPIGYSLDLTEGEQWRTQ